MANQCELYYTLNRHFIERNDDTYRDGFCHENALCLARQLVAGGVDRRDLRVIAIQAREPYKPIIPYGMNRGKYLDYSFHVALEYKDSILDYDSFGNGDAVLANDFFSRHFPNYEKQPLEIRRFTLDEYEKIKNDHPQRFVHYVLGLPEFYVGSLHDYLSTKGTSKLTPAKTSLDFKAFSAWTYMRRVKTDMSRDVRVKRFLEFIGVNKSVTLNIYDSNQNEYVPVRATVISIHDRYSVLKSRDGRELTVPHMIVDDEPFHRTPGFW